MPIFVWGRGEDGQLGLGDTIDRARPILCDAECAKAVCNIAAGSGHTAMLTIDGKVYTCGRGDDGRLGHADTGWKYVPRLVTALEDKRVVSVTCGSYHTACMTDDGECWTWGGGLYGKLGHGDETGHWAPRRVEALAGKRTVMMACGSRHTVALTADYEVYTWGDLENGVCGVGETEGHQFFPRLIPTLRDVRITRVSACGFHTAMVSDDGRLFTTGEGKFGRLGHGDEENVTAPKLVEALAGVVIIDVACGGFHTACVDETGVCWTFGGGEHGQLGLSDRANHALPSRVATLLGHHVTEVSCGWSHTVALTDAGEVWTWGNGDHGKLGHGDAERVLVPRRVDELVGKHVVRVASYNEHTVAITDMDPLLSVSVGLPSTMVTDLKQMVNQREYADITFLVEGTPVYAHRAVLAARCDHFRSMFASGMRESSQSEIVLRDVARAPFLAVLEYLYTDTTSLTPELAVDVHALADLFVLDRLKALCEWRVEHALRVETAPLLLARSDRYPSTARLREACLRFIVRHFDEVTRSAAFAELSKELILEVLHLR